MTINYSFIHSSMTHQVYDAVIDEGELAVEGVAGDELVRRLRVVKVRGVGGGRYLNR